MVTLINEFSASDGDIFPYRFKTLGLGKLIGKRTWGGVIGIRNPLPLLDGGQIFKPEFAPYSREGKGWIIEGHGVDPDIVVDNDPAKEFKGEDQQLDRGIAEVQAEMKTKGYQLPPVPPYPIGTRLMAGRARLTAVPTFPREISVFLPIKRWFASTGNSLSGLKSSMMSCRKKE